MNVYELGTKTLTLCKLEMSDREENAAKFLSSFNYAYERVMREKWRPWTTEAVTLDADKCFTVSSLSKRCVSVKKITNLPDFSEDAGYGYAAQYNFFEKDGDGTLFVYGAGANATVYVQYQYVPARLIDMGTYDPETFVATATNTPQFDEAYHDVLCYWAAYEYFEGRGANYIQKALEMKDGFRREFGRIKRDYGVKQEHLNCYRPL